MNHEEALAAVHLCLIGTGDDDPSSDEPPVIFENYSPFNRMDDEELLKWREASFGEYDRYQAYGDAEYDNKENQ